MSKALCSAALAATTTTSAPRGGISLGLLAVGMCVLTGWVIVRILRLEKLFLRRVPGRKNQIHVLHLLALFLVYFFAPPLAASALATAMGAELAQGQELPMEVRLPAMIFGQLVLIGGALTVASMSFRHGLRRGLGLSPRHSLCDAGRGLVGYLAVFPLCYLALYVTWRLIPSEWVTMHPVLTFVPAASPAWVSLVVISAVVLAPVAEELFYRGLVQSMLRGHELSPWPAILITSGLFALSHASQLQDMPALFVLALALGYNYERTGRLIAPMVLHAVFNAVSIWSMLAG
jgi:membrane protease YdiL (CAAX protease family)